MLQDFNNHLNRKFPFLLKKNLLLAISGGVDSMVLLDLMRILKFNFSVAHCNFNLRDEASDLDQKLVQDYCNLHNINFFVNSFNTIEYSNLHKQSIQIAARELRYNWFLDLLANKDLDYLITAHHLDDSVETFLINFSRGTGIDGLLGIPEINDKTIRPLLNFSRERILKHAISNKIIWREDASNASVKYLRNKIRHEVVPVLKSVNIDFLQTFQQTISNLNDAKNLMIDACEMVAAVVFIKSEHLLEIDIDKLKQFNNYKIYLFHWLRKYNFKVWNDVYDLVDAETGKKIYSENYVLLKNRSSLILNNANIDNNESYYLLDKESLILSSISIIFEKFSCDDLKNQNSNEIILDEDLLVFPLKLRKWKEGDYFYPFGMNGKQKVSKYFKNEKFSLFEKQKTWILENNSKEIIWIVGSRMDNRFKITNQTINKIKIKLIQ